MKDFFYVGQHLKKLVSNCSDTLSRTRCTVVKIDVDVDKFVPPFLVVFFFSRCYATFHGEAKVFITILS